MTFADYQLTEICVDPPGIISDHSLVRCRLPAVVDSASSTTRLVRAWRQVDRDTLRRALEESARRYTLYDVVQTAVRFGSTPTVVMHVVNAAAMNVATRSLVLSLTDVSGWTLYV